MSNDVQIMKDVAEPIKMMEKAKEGELVGTKEDAPPSSEGDGKTTLSISAPPLTEKELKHRRLRIKVLEEIVETERTYVQDLNFILKNFVVPCKKLISEEDSVLIYSNIATLHSVHQTIYASLAERVSGSNVTSPSTAATATTTISTASGAPQPVPTHVLEDKEGDATGSPRVKPLVHDKVESDFMLADIFVKNADYLKFYTTYTLNQSESLQAIRRLKQNSVTFNAFLRGMQNKKTDIGSYLIKPVQRICKYPLLLRELLKYTPENHPDRENLALALEKVQAVATHVDVHNQRVQNIAKMMEIQRALVTGKHKFEIVKPSRVFIMEGDLTSFKAGTQKAGKTVRAFLFNDVLVLARKGKDRPDQKDDAGQAQSSSTFTFQLRFSLKLTQVRELDKSGLTNAFEVLQPTLGGQGKKARGSLKGSTGLILQAATLAEKEKWVQAINQCKKELQAKIMAQIQATSDSKKNRANTMVPHLNYLKREDDDFDEDSANSESSYSPRGDGSPRTIRSTSDVEDSSQKGLEVIQKNPLLNVPAGLTASRSLPSSPSAARRRSSSYTQIITPQTLLKEREKDKEREERKKKEKKEKKEHKKKKKGRASDGEEPTGGNDGGSGRKKVGGIRRDLFSSLEELPVDSNEDSDGGDAASGDEKDKEKSSNKHNKKESSLKPKHMKDRSRSRSFNQLPPLNDSNKISRPDSPTTLGGGGGGGSLIVPIEPPSKPRAVVFKKELEPSKLLPSPARRKSAAIELTDDDDEDDALMHLRTKLAEERLKKNKWKERYAALKLKYEELEKKLAESNSNNINNNYKKGEEMMCEGAGGETIENLTRTLAGLSHVSDEDTTSGDQERAQMLLAQRKNELEEKKRILESKRKELEEKRRVVL